MRTEGLHSIKKIVSQALTGTGQPNRVEKPFGLPAKNNLRRNRGWQGDKKPGLLLYFSLAAAVITVFSAEKSICLPWSCVSPTSNFKRDDESCWKFIEKSPSAKPVAPAVTCAVEKTQISCVREEGHYNLTCIFIIKA